ncbi:MAG: hypothetical protein ABI144_04865 [Gallionella sp.]
MNNPGSEIMEQKVQRAAAINALRKIGLIVARERKVDTDKTRVLRWLSRYGWIALPGIALLVAYLIVMI